MKKKKVKVMALSVSATQDTAFVAVLSELKGPNKIPVILKAADAQNIAIKMENIKIQRPLTHDLFKSFSDTFEVEIKECLIYNIIEGLFYAKIICEKDFNIVEIECGVGDAIALSLTYDCPLYVSNDIFDIVGIKMNDDGTKIDEEDELDSEDDSEEIQISSKPSLDDLQKRMENAIQNENYELAAKIRDEITKFQNN